MRKLWGAPGNALTDTPNGVLKPVTYIKTVFTPPPSASKEDRVFLFFLAGWYGKKIKLVSFENLSIVCLPQT